MRRFSMKLPAAVRVSGIPSEFPTETENVSARGIFFYIGRWMTEGSRVEVTMTVADRKTESTVGVQKDGAYSFPAIQNGRYDVRYLYVLAGEVVVTAIYLFQTYWIGMRNMMYANR